MYKRKKQRDTDFGRLSRCHLSFSQQQEKDRIDNLYRDVDNFLLSRNSSFEEKRNALVKLKPPCKG